MEFYVYILESELDSSLYIGHTNNIERRLEEHNEGISRYTKSKRPWKLIYKEAFYTRGEAMRFEKKLKSWRNREYIFEYIKNKGAVG